MILLCCNTSDHGPPSDKPRYGHPALPNLTQCGKPTPRPFSSVGNRASSGCEPQLSDVSMQRSAAPFLYGFPRSNVFHVLTTQAAGGVTDLSKDSIPYGCIGFNSLPDDGQIGQYRDTRRELFRSKPDGES